jgi:hypothetical protein
VRHGDHVLIDSAKSGLTFNVAEPARAAR